MAPEPIRTLIKKFGVEEGSVARGIYRGEGTCVGGVILVGTIPLGGLLITSRIIEHDVAGSFECLCFQEFEDDSFGDAFK